MSDCLLNKLSFNGYYISSYYLLASERRKRLGDNLETPEEVLEFYHQYDRESQPHHFPSAQEVVGFMIREWGAMDITILDAQGILIASSPK